MKPETMKLLKETQAEHSLTQIRERERERERERYLDPSASAKEIKAKINKWDLIKI